MKVPARVVPSCVLNNAVWWRSALVPPRFVDMMNDAMRSAEHSQNPHRNPFMP